MDKPLGPGILINSKSPEEIKAAKAIEDQKKIAEEQERRFNIVADKIMNILAEEKVLVNELPAIVSIVSKRVNEKWNTSEIDKILKL